jgi:hypothetical protein
VVTTPGKKAFHDCSKHRLQVLFFRGFANALEIMFLQSTEITVHEPVGTYSGPQVRFWEVGNFI